MSLAIVCDAWLGRARRISMTRGRIGVPIAMRVVPIFRQIIPSATSVMVVSPISTFLVGSGVVIRAPLVGRSRVLVVGASVIRGSVVCSGIVRRMMGRPVTMWIVVSVTVVVTAKERNVWILETIYVEHFTGNVRTKKMKKVKGISRHKHSAVLRQMTTENGKRPIPVTWSVLVWCTTSLRVAERGPTGIVSIPASRMPSPTVGSRPRICTVHPWNLSHRPYVRGAHAVCWSFELAGSLRRMIACVFFGEGPSWRVLRWPLRMRSGFVLGTLKVINKHAVKLTLG